MFKIMTIVGTRPEIIKMSRVIAEFDTYTQHILVNTQQNNDYELNKIFFDEMGVRKPDYFLGVSNNSTAISISEIIEKSDKIMVKEKPDAILIYGDTNSCLSVIAAKRRQIPVFHMEAGNRCFDQRVPEELNRKIIDHLSDINLVITEHARRYLINEGIKQENIIKTGSHMKEIFNFYEKEISQSDILTRINIKSKKYFIVSIHRQENIIDKKNIKEILESLSKLSEHYKLPIIISTHPRLKKALDSSKTHIDDLNLIFCKPFGFFDYIKLQMNALCILSDSGTLSEEASLLNLPAIHLREITERPEAMDSGVFIVSLKHESILEAVKIIINDHATKDTVRNTVQDYENSGIVSKKVLRIVLSYIGYVNRTVWFK